MWLHLELDRLQNTVSCSCTQILLYESFNKLSRFLLDILGTDTYT